MIPLLCIVPRPLIAIEMLKEKPRWVAPFLLLAILNILLLIYEYPSTITGTLDHLPFSATAFDKEIIRQHLSVDLFARSLFLPIRLLAGWSVFALILYEACRWLSSVERLRFGQIFSLEVHAEGVLIVGKFIVTFLNQFIHRSGSLPAIPLSAAVLSQASSDFITVSLLNSLNAFNAWYVFILVIGVRRMCKFGLMQSILLVMIVWGLLLIWNVGITWYLLETLQLKP